MDDKDRTIRIQQSLIENFEKEKCKTVVDTNLSAHDLKNTETANCATQTERVSFKINYTFNRNNHEYFSFPFSCVQFPWDKTLYQGNLMPINNKTRATSIKKRPKIHRLLSLLRTCLGIPVYFSQLLSLVPFLFAHRVSNNPKPIVNEVNFDLRSRLTIRQNRELLKDLQLQIFSKYFLNPYHFSCWYFSSYKMILQNKFYVSVNYAKKFINNAKLFLRANFFITMTGFYIRIIN